MVFCADLFFFGTACLHLTRIFGFQKTDFTFAQNLRADRYGLPPAVTGCRLVTAWLPRKKSSTFLRRYAQAPAAFFMRHWLPLLVTGAGQGIRRQELSCPNHFTPSEPRPCPPCVQHLDPPAFPTRPERQAPRAPSLTFKSRIYRISARIYFFPGRFFLA